MRDDITLLDENDTIDDIKNEVLYHVAKAAFEDNLDGILARLPYEILPGSFSKNASSTSNSLLTSMRIA